MEVKGKKEKVKKVNEDKVEERMVIRREGKNGRSGRKNEKRSGRGSGRE